MKPIFFTLLLSFSAFTSFSQWTIQNPAVTQNSLNTISFPDFSTGYIGGNAGTIVKTTDGGETWSLLSTGTEEFLFFTPVYRFTNGFCINRHGKCS